MLSQIKKGRLPKELPDKAAGIEDPQIKRLIERMIEAKKEKKGSLDAKMWGYSSFDLSAPYDIFDLRVSRHRDGPDEILGGYGHRTSCAAASARRSAKGQITLRIDLMRRGWKMRLILRVPLAADIVLPGTTHLLGGASLATCMPTRWAENPSSHRESLTNPKDISMPELK
jgi:hypothetical protein